MTNKSFGSVQPMQETVHAILTIPCTVEGVNYEQWLDIGKLVHTLMPTPSGLHLWDEWSKGGDIGDPRYVTGDCAARWETFNAAAKALPELRMAPTAGQMCTFYVTPSLAALLGERDRQIGQKGYDSYSDRRYVADELARAAAAYLLPDNHQPTGRALWPWQRMSYKPTQVDYHPNPLVRRRRDVIRGAALALAEIERLDAAIAAQETRDV